MSIIFQGNITAADRRRARELRRILSRQAVDRDDASLTEILAYLSELEQDFDDIERMYDSTLQHSQTMERELSQTNQEVSSFVVNMSHEIRTPLNAIIGYAELVEEELEETELSDLTADVDKIQRAGHHLLRLINDILDMSKLEAGKLEFIIEDVDIDELVQDVYRTIHTLVDRHGNAFVLDVDIAYPRMMSDAGRLRQCLLNLISNASKFTKEGEVKVAVRTVTDEIDWVAYSVSDNGIGMTEEQVLRVFRPFEQATQTTSKEYGGTGLGLPLTRELARQMGGDIAVDSAFGKGATFTLTLPREGLEAASGRKPPRPGTAAQVSAPSEEQHSGPFLGREPEMAVLRARLDKGAANAVVLVAPAGQGKSRLLHEFRRETQVTSPAMRIWRGAGESVRKGSPYAVIGSIIRSLADINDGDVPAAQSEKLRRAVRLVVEEDDVDRIADFIGELANVQASAVPSAQLEAARSNANLMSDQRQRAWLDFVRAAADPALVLCIDDLHWADRPSVALLENTLISAPELSVLIIGTARPDVNEVHPYLFGDRVHLAPLGESDGKELVASLLPETPLPAQERIAVRAAGNPLLIEQLVRSEAAGRDTVARTAIAVIEEQFQRLTPEALAVLKAGSVFGARFWTRPVASMLPELPDSVVSGLPELVAEKLVKPVLHPQFEDEEEMEFANDLVRQAALRLLDGWDKRAFHSVAGSWLHGKGERDAAVLANHFEAGGELATALEWCSEGARRALEAHDFETATALCQRGLSLGARGANLGALHLVLAEVHRWRGEPEAVEHSAKSAAEILLHGNPLWFKAVSELIWSAGKRGDYPAAAAWARMAASVRTDLDARDAQVICLCAASREVFQAGRYELADALMDRVRALVGDGTEVRPRTRAEVHRLAGARARQLGDLGGDLSGYRAALLAFEEAGDVRAACNARVAVGFACIEVGDYLEAQILLDRALADADGMGLADTSTKARRNLALVCSRLGAIEMAMELIEQVVDEAERAEDVREEGWARIYRANILCQAGDLHRAEVDAVAAVNKLEIAQPAKAGALAALSRVLSLAGRASEAVAPAEAAMEILQRYGGIEEFESSVWLALGEAQLAVGDANGARRTLLQARERLRTRAANIHQTGHRDGFLERVPENARILYLCREWVEAPTRAPGYDVESFRDLGHAVVDRLTAHLQQTLTTASTDVIKWRDPDKMAQRWPNAFPSEPTEPMPLVERLLEDSIHQHHPRYIGHQVAATLPNAAIFDLVASLLNNGSSSYDAGPATATMEQSSIHWMLGHLGWKDGGGILTSGGSVGNLTALLAARQAAIDNAWADGGSDFAFLVSGAAHYSLHRAIRIMGLGDAGAIEVEVDSEGRMSRDALAIAHGKANRRVIGVVANAGATVTGCIDPLPEIATWCEENDLWLHVDGAHGASALVSEAHRDILAGIERADSVVWDAHKMLSLPALITGVLFRENRASYATFAQDASYVFLDGQEPERWYDTGLRTLECTKRMVGATLYLTLATVGTNALAANIVTMFERTRELAALLRGLPDFEVLADPTLNILCYRHLDGSDDLDAHQLAVRERLIRDGSFYLTRTTFQGRTWLRSTVVNPATQTSDLHALVQSIRDVT